MVAMLAKLRTGTSGAVAMKLLVKATPWLNLASNKKLNSMNHSNTSCVTICPIRFETKCRIRISCIQPIVMSEKFDQTLEIGFSFDNRKQAPRTI
ncbi:hypothetical protein KIN20_004903 [Parelaphostrongylus tenuis]|uniref:Uncharacterized protein n=1 Tax=Parelaphostrongylus tenuis TaxID=148309 RepID=A0AAD5MRZ6_PARTN|nr:hypothetical protein KIN20_004903 [Parelaphostrongylus tenuis]